MKTVQEGPRQAGPVHQDGLAEEAEAAEDRRALAAAVVAAEADEIHAPCCGRRIR